MIIVIPLSSKIWYLKFLQFTGGPLEMLKLGTLMENDHYIISSPVGSLCHTPGVVRRLSSVVRRESSVVCRLCPP